MLDIPDFVRTIRELNTPSNYVGQLSKKITANGELRRLKTHDHHILMQQIMPLCLRTLLPKQGLHTSCAKSVDPSKMDELLEKTTTNMCMLEKVFPLSFFDVMLHMPFHLVKQLQVCGPVHTQWMYPVGHYLKTLKGYIQQHAQQEGSMARGYIMDEVLGFCT